MMVPTHEDVARLAFELFLARGTGHGSAVQDWLEAERQLTARTTRSPKKTAPSPRRRT
jgi:Protein of unknown function (DUF2934)